jgi:hypothetical protein
MSGKSTMLRMISKVWSAEAWAATSNRNDCACCVTWTVVRESTNVTQTTTRKSFASAQVCGLIITSSTHHVHLQLHISDLRTLLCMYFFQSIRARRSVLNHHPSPPDVRSLRPPGTRARHLWHISTPTYSFRTTFAKSATESGSKGTDVDVPRSGTRASFWASIMAMNTGVVWGLSFLMVRGVFRMASEYVMARKA